MFKRFRHFIFRHMTHRKKHLLWPSYNKSMVSCNLHILWNPGSPLPARCSNPLRYSDSMCVASNGYKKLVAPPPRAPPVKTSNSLLPSNGFRWKSTRSQA